MHQRIAVMGWARTAAMAVALAAGLSLAVASVAQASAVRTARGTYRTWRAAQHAAGFALLQPGRTYGLHRSSPIIVEKCQFTGTVKRKAVFVSYSGSRDRSVNIQESNYKLTCGNIGEARLLGHYLVHGTRAKLLGSCNLPHTPSCSKLKKELYLIWTHRGKTYEVGCFAFRRRTVVAFARAMHPVR